MMITNSYSHAEVWYIWGWDFGYNDFGLDVDDYFFTSKKFIEKQNNLGLTKDANVCENRYNQKSV